MKKIQAIPWGFMFLFERKEFWLSCERGENADIENGESPSSFTGVGKWIEAEEYGEWIKAWLLFESP